MTEHLDLPAPQVRERLARGTSGWPVVALSLLVIVLSVAVFVIGVRQEGAAAVASLIGLSLVLALAALGTAAGLTPVSPGEARVLQLLGRYTERCAPRDSAGSTRSPPGARSPPASATTKRMYSR
ncbi:hypothetical protein ACFQX7_37390 [Luedemannella flava]